MTSDPSEVETIDVTFTDMQGGVYDLGVLPESVSKLVTLMTKATIGACLAYFSLTEVFVEVKRYHAHLLRGSTNGSRDI